MIEETDDGFILEFDAKDMDRVVSHSLVSGDFREWFDKKFEKSTIFLVGDRGVYFISAGYPSDRVSAENEPTRLFVAYAKGINPEVDEFDDWWNNKRTVFGSDDFCEFFHCCDEIKRRIDQGEDVIQMEVTDTHLRII